MGPAFSAEQAAQQGNQGSADQSNTAAGHQLLHALALCAGVVRAVTFQQVDAALHAKTSAQGNNEGLQNINGRIEKFHSRFLLN